jgi:AcrR family transcriptional regulator
MARLAAAAKQQVRDRLLVSAAAQFAEHGLDGANIDRISLDADCAKGTVYNYFASKEELFGQVLAEGCRRAVERVAKVPEGGTLQHRLVALGEADVAELRDEEPFMKVVVREAMSFRPRTYPLVIEHLRPYLQAVEEVLLPGRERGELRGDRPVAELALLFVGTLTLLYVQHWGSGGTWPDLSDIPALAVTMFLDGARGER